VQAGAILIVGAETGKTADEFPASSGLNVSDQPLGLLNEPLACLEILGRTTVERMIERFLREDLAVVSVLIDASVSRLVSTGKPEWNSDRLNYQVVDDVLSAMAGTLKEYSEAGIDHTVVATAGAYVECDVQDLLQFHRERRQAVTRGFDSLGALDFWAVDSAQADEAALAFLSPPSEAPTGASSYYFVKPYVNRLATPRHLRQFVTDALRGRCEARPSGRETRPGVWIDEGAQLHRRARIVAPAYIGRGSRVREDTLITRCSNIESFSCVDYGTVIEDSTVLANSYVGIWLDVSHALVRGNKLLNLERDVLLEFSDTSLIRENTVVSKGVRREFAPPVTAGPSHLRLRERLEMLNIF
jgi:NDP-sugar pyrophosphorylase family protein